MMINKRALAVLLGFLLSLNSWANSKEGEVKGDSTKIDLEYGSKGFQMTTADNKFRLNIRGRLQFRYTTPFEDDPVTFEDLNGPTRNSLNINRARLKIGGHAYQPWLKYYFEYDLWASRILDFRIMVEKWPWLNFKIGQWKVEYSRERSVSSGKQQMLERSIINRPFTVDRQQGATVYGHLDGGGLANFDYNLSVLTGSGRGGGENDDEKMMYVGRLQWNVLGDGVPISGSDLDHVRDPLASIALAGATNTSPYTRFSSSGGGRLAGFTTDGAPGQFSIDQWLLETAFQYKSFSWHSEYHQKQIQDNVNNMTSTLEGFFGQGGYILNHHAAQENNPLYEVAVRYSQYRPNNDFSTNRKEEYGLTFNCFFKGHKNKLTGDATYFEFDNENTVQESSGWRFRLQYDISF